MKTFSTNNQIFAPLLNDPTVNPEALRRLVGIANANPELNAYLSQADSAANINIRLATSQELRQLGAGAFFSYDLKLQDNDGKMSIALDPAWLVGDNALIATGGVNRANVAGMVTHELDHYMRVELFRATDDLADPNKVFPNLSATERFEMYASQRMQVEVMGWYESLQAQRFERTGSVTGTLSTGQLMSVGLVERELYALDQRGRAMGLQGEALERYVAEGGARVLSSSNSPYWDSYVQVMQAATPDVDFKAVRQQMAYALQSPDDVVAWQETIGENGATLTEITYRDGSRQSVVEGLDGHSIVEQFNADGSLAQRVESSIGAGATQTTIIRDFTDLDAEGGGETTTRWMQGLVDGLQAQLSGSGYSMVPNLLPAIGFQYNPDGFSYQGSTGPTLALQSQQARAATNDLAWRLAA